MVIDQPYLTRLADEPSFAWMASLRPLRVWRVAGGGNKGCCGKARRVVPSEVFQQIAGDLQFARDLQELKLRLKVAKLVVNIDGYRSAL